MTDVTTNRVDAIVTQLRQYDQGLKDWVQNGVPVKQDGKPPPVIFSTPHRAFAAMQHLLKGELGSRVNDLKNIPLPFISITRTRIMYDPERFHGPNTEFRKLATSADLGSVYKSQFPLPYDVTYDVNVWAKNRETLNAYQLWSMLQFKNGFETFVSIRLDEVWASWRTKSIPFETEGITDNSDLEPQEGHRVLRFTQQLTAKAWLLCEVEEVKAVHEILQDFYLVEDCTVDLQTTTAAGVDGDPDTYDKVMRVTTDDDGDAVQNF